MSAIPPSALREAQKAAARTASAASAVAAAMAAQELQAVEKRKDNGTEKNRGESDSSQSPLEQDSEAQQQEEDAEAQGGKETEEEEMGESRGKKKESATFFQLGVDIELSQSATEIDCQASRIQRLENLDQCPQLKRLALNANEIEKLENLETVPLLEELELYQNHIRKIENLSCLPRLKVLDLSFNKIRVVEGVENLHELEKLYLSSNKIATVENLENNGKLVVLELGGNRLREVKNISHLQLLEELWLGKNKLTTMELPPLPVLRRLSLQSNRLQQWSEALFSSCPLLQELYLSNNRLRGKVPDSVKLLKFLKVLDLGANEITDVEAVADLPELQEFWANDNQVPDLSCITCFAGAKKLEVLYLERNPLHYNLGPSYRPSVTRILPQLKQLDALLLSDTINIVESRRSTAGSDFKPKSILKHD